jgi:hypothetical protein
VLTAIIVPFALHLDQAPDGSQWLNPDLFATGLRSRLAAHPQPHGHHCGRPGCRTPAAVSRDFLTANHAERVERIHSALFSK